jgi:alpha-L-fucosidase
MNGKLNAIMKIPKLVGVSCLLLFMVAKAIAQPYEANWASLEKRPIPEWFQQDKFGIFIHWGVYAVPSFSLVIPDGYSEWYWANLNEPKRHNHKAVTEFHNRVYGNNFTYHDFAPQFKAELYDPAEWAEIFKRSGAQYVVLTSKHHDGFALWPSKEADESWGRPWNAVSIGPKRDVLGDLTNEVRKAGLKMGFYYSLMEWYNPVHEKDPAAYVDKVMMPQFKDLITRYKPSVIFSDGEWIKSDTAWRSTELLSWLYNESPVKKEVVVNDRWGKNARKTHPGTYYTSEYGSGLSKNVVWEESRGMGQSYGYNRMEKLKDYKTADELVVILTDIVSKGGNLLLDIGPAADGTIPVIMEERLTGMGKWLQVNGEAIYGTEPWKHDRQWSAGQQPQIKGGEYQTDYDVNDWVKPNNEHAHIQMFFTTKEKDVYAIVPYYTPQILIKDISLATGAQISILGCNKKIEWKKQGNGVLIDVSKLQPGDLPGRIFTVRIKDAE